MAGFSYGNHFKNVQDYMNATKPDGTVVIKFTPIALYDTSDAVENLCNAYEQARFIQAFFADISWVKVELHILQGDGLH